MEVNKILRSLAEKYGITPIQAKELYDQYWMEYVLKRMESLRFPKIYLEGIGLYQLSKASVTKILKSPNVRDNKRKKFTELNKLIINDEYQINLKIIASKSPTTPLQSLLYNRKDQISTREEGIEFFNQKEDIVRRRKKSKLSSEMFE